MSCRGNTLKSYFYDRPDRLDNIVFKKTSRNVFEGLPKSRKRFA